MKFIIVGDNHNIDYESFKTGVLKRLFNLYASGVKSYGCLFNEVDARNNVFQINECNIEFVCNREDPVYDMARALAKDFEIKLLMCRGDKSHMDRLMKKYTSIKTSKIKCK